MKKNLSECIKTHELQEKGTLSIVPGEPEEIRVELAKKLIHKSIKVPYSIGEYRIDENQLADPTKLVLRDHKSTWKEVTLRFFSLNPKESIVHISYDQTMLNKHLNVKYGIYALSALFFLVLLYIYPITFPASGFGPLLLVFSLFLPLYYFLLKALAEYSMKIQTAPIEEHLSNLVLLDKITNGVCD